MFLNLTIEIYSPFISLKIKSTHQKLGEKLAKLGRRRSIKCQGWKWQGGGEKIGVNCIV